MGKRKRKSKRRQRADLPLFDLPLNATAEEAAGSPENLDGSVAEPQPDSESVPATNEPASQDPAALEFDRSRIEPEDPSSADASQLELVDLGSGSKPETDPAADSSEEGVPPDGVTEARDEPAESRALLGDRLLGGLADLSVQVFTLGVALAACHALGVAVTLADWQPFGVLLAAFSFLYWVVPLAFWGQTPGMAWVGHTARAQSGQPLTFSQTLRRWLGAALTLALAGLPLLLALTGRSLTDRLSNSVTRGG